MMNILPVVLLMLLSLNAFAIQPAITSATPVVALMPVVLSNPDFFEFTPDQQKKVAEIAQKTGQVREGLDQSILDMRAELRETLMQFRPDPKLITSLQKEVKQLEAQRLDLSISCAQDLRKIMNAAQWKTLIELVSQ